MIHLVKYILTVFAVTGNCYAQGTGKATLSISFESTDTTRSCRVIFLSDSNLPVKEKDIHLYVKSLYSLLPIGEAVASDDKGESVFAFPMDLPGDKNHLLTVIARVEDDEVYGTVEATTKVKWGISPKADLLNINKRSLAASREHAPMFLVIASIVIIGIIWGTIFYILIQLIKIRKSSTIEKSITAVAAK